MPDMLVKLYNLKDDWRFLQKQEAKGVAVRKPIGPEKHLAIAWIKAHFSGAWASEFDQAMSNRPITCFIAIQDEQMIGFACYDATALGFFGPTGVAKEYRGQGTGKALLKACMLDMKLKGYGYAVIGAVGPAEFYRQTVGATVIPDSEPSIWKNWLHAPDESL